VELETWRAVPGREGEYEVSDIGRVRSLPRERTRGGVLKMPLSTRGYRRVNLRGKAVHVHQLVLEAFVGPKPAGLEARHLDDDRLNNLASNLAWGTRKENYDDAVRHGRHVNAGGRSE
jgi:hypothetical protein